MAQLSNPASAIVDCRSLGAHHRAHVAL